LKCEIQLDWFHAKTIGGVDLAGIKMAGGENTAAQVPMDVAKDEKAKLMEKWTKSRPYRMLSVRLIVER
jgi:hypothetical protein